MDVCKRSLVNFYLVSRQIMRVYAPRSLFFSTQPALKLKFYSPEPKGFLKDVPIEELTSETEIPSHIILDKLKEANVPRLSLSLRYFLKSFQRIPAGVTPEILNGVIAWSHSKSALSSRYYTGFQSEYERELYNAVQKFALLSFKDRQSPLQIQQNTIGRAIHSKYLDLFTRSGMSFEEFLEPHPEFLIKLGESRLGDFKLLDYERQFPKDTIIQFNPVTSWTLFDLRNRYGAESLARPYPNTSHTDIIFVALNANKPHSWGSVTGKLSIIPEEKEVLIPSYINMRVIKGAHMSRNLLRDIPLEQRVPGNSSLYERVTQLVHVIYVEFIDVEGVPAK